MEAKVVQSAKITSQGSANNVFHGSPDEVLAMNVERKCVQKAVEFVRSRPLRRRAPIVLILHTAAAGTLLQLRDQMVRGAEFAGIFIIDYVVCGKTTVSLMPTDLSRKAWLKGIDTLVQSHVVSVDMVRQSWTYLPSREGSKFE